MKIIEIPATLTITLGADLSGCGGRTFEYSFGAWLREAIVAPTSGLGAWDKADILMALFGAAKAAVKPGAYEIVLEDAWYDALLAAVKAFVMNPEASIQVAEGGYRNAILNPKKGKAEK